MAAPERLSPDAITRELAGITGWTHEADRLKKTFTFRNFVEAFGWMSMVALEAEKRNHHPNWSNVYKTVDVELWTHDAGGLTAKDFDLAKAMDRHAG